MGAARVATGVRPGGFSSRRETSRSPNTVSSRVRGIGVADMASRWVASPLACSRRRSETPKRCCSSITVRARPLEGDVVLEQGVGADGDGALARGEGRQLLRPRRALVAAGEQDAP